jgi:hypothetical protein
MSPKLSFKSKHLIKSFFNHDKYNTKITKYTINILKKFYKQIQTSKEHIKNIDLKSSLKIVDYIIKPVNFSYMEKEVQNNIIQTLKITATYTIRIYNKYVKINFIVDKLDLEYINNCVYKILLWLFIVMKNTSSNNHVNIYLYMTSLEKNLPTDDNQITKYNINSGYTSTNENNIVVFRKEEWFKVFIHESLHFFEFDFRHDNHIKNKVLEMFKVKSKVNLYEAYTETWAKIINIVFCSYFLSTNFNTFIDIFETLINIEKIYAIYQMLKILNYMDMEYNDILTGDNLYYEKTHILSYYIIGTILLNNYQEFIKFCNENNDYIFNFKETRSNTTKFLKFIKRYYKSQKLFDKIETVNKIKIMNPYVLKNTRLSICELD